MAELRVAPQRITHDLLTNRLDCPFYHPQAIELEGYLREYGKIKSLSNLVDPNRKITNGVRGPDLKLSKYLLVRLQDCSDWAIDFNQCLTISGKQFNENKRCQLYDGDVVVAIGGYVGNASVVRGEHLAVIGQHSAVLPHNPNEIDERYLLAYLNSKWGAVQLQRYVSGTVQAGVNLEDLREIFIPYPEPQVQKYIGDKVRQAEQLRERSRELELALHKKMEECFQGNPKPPQNKFSTISVNYLTDDRLESEFYTPLVLWADEEIKGSFWNYKPLAELTSRIKDGPGGWGVSTNDYVSDGIPIIRATNLIDGECNLSDCVFITQQKHEELIRHKAELGSVLLSVRGTIGRAAVF